MKKKKLTKKEIAIMDIKCEFAEKVLALRDRFDAKYPKMKLSFNYELTIK